MRSLIIIEVEHIAGRVMGAKAEQRAEDYEQAGRSVEQSTEFDHTESGVITVPRGFTVDDLPMGGCVPAAAHFAHLAAGNPLCQNQPGGPVLLRSLYLYILAETEWHGVDSWYTTVEGTH